MYYPQCFLFELLVFCLLEFHNCVGRFAPMAVLHPQLGKWLSREMATLPVTSGDAHLELAEATSSNAWFDGWNMLENGSIHDIVDFRGLQLLETPVHHKLFIK